MSHVNSELIGISKNIQRIRELIEHVADTGLNILISGETGVGKELVAQSLYYNSPRRGKPFIKVNCAALPDGLLESELFGFERGAFTGADRKMKGKIELANNGVLFLDEIGDMTLSLQSKLLHVIQSCEFAPLGSEKSVKTDTWIIAATNHDLEQDVSNGLFREDLYYRLNIIKLHIEPLRNRAEDIPLLIDYFYKQYGHMSKSKIFRLGRKEMDTFVDYNWPGNVRQLQNILKKAIILNNWEEILQEMQYGSKPFNSLSSNTPMLPENEGNHWPKTLTFDPDNQEGFSLKKAIRQATDAVEKKIIYQVLQHTGWNRVKASKILDISYKTLLYKIKYLKLKP